MGRFMATFEALGMFDLNLVVKFGVQFGLFGGSILFLGTQRHHDAYLQRVADLELLGGFAMTELGHGSNVRDIRTTATFDVETDEFVIDTPDDHARKEWIGNAAVHARMMTVFAQLVIGEDNFGVHAFLVPVRDEAGDALEGVRLGDCGHKMGLNGVDNGRIWFDQVRIPRDNLLDRHATVSVDGDYSSPIPSAGKRFFTMLGTLVAGRISVGAAALTATKSALAIATRYAAMRRQFGPAGEPEKPILNFRTHQKRLMPRIATAYALHFATQALRRRYIETRGDADTREVEAMAAAIKAFSTWNAIEAVQEARECCGGMGYASQNRLPAIRTDVDVFATFEGDNTVLMMLVARSLLTNYKQQFEDASLLTLVRFVAGRAAGAVQDRNPLVTRDTDPEHLRRADMQRELFRTREEHLLSSAARRLRQRLDDGMDAFSAFNEVQLHLFRLAEAHAERLVFDCFADRVDQVDDPALRDTLALLRDLFALEYLQRDIGWFLEHGYVEPPKARAMRRAARRSLPGGSPAGPSAGRRVGHPRRGARRPNRVSELAGHAGCAHVGPRSPPRAWPPAARRHHTIGVAGGFTWALGGVAPLTPEPCDLGSKHTVEVGECAGSCPSGATGVRGAGRRARSYLLACEPRRRPPHPRSAGEPTSRTDEPNRRRNEQRREQFAKRLVASHRDLGFVDHLVVGKRPRGELPRVGARAGRAWPPHGVLERDVPCYAAHRDLPQPPYGRPFLYEDLDDLRRRFLAEIRAADLVIVGIARSRGVEVGRFVLNRARGVTAFYDLDTPATLAKLDRQECDYLDPQFVGEYDIYLSCTGGPILDELEQTYASPMARPFFCTVDPDDYRPVDAQRSWLMGYLGRHSDARQPRVEALLNVPARRLGRHNFVVAGPGFPSAIDWPANVARVDHIAPPEHCAFYNAQRFTLNVTRDDRTAAGYSPSVRLFGGRRVCHAGHHRRPGGDRHLVYPGRGDLGG